MFKKGMVLQFLQARGINIPSLDLAGVQAWAEECRQAVADGYAAPAASFRIDGFTGDIEYVSGSGDTRIFIPGSGDECKLFSVCEDAHIDRLSLEVSLLFPEGDYEKGFRSDVDYYFGVDGDYVRDSEGMVLLQCRQWYDTARQGEILGGHVEPTYY